MRNEEDWRRAVGRGGVGGGWRERLERIINPFIKGLLRSEGASFCVNMCMCVCVCVWDG